jgi:hypothetical protein
MSITQCVCVCVCVRACVCVCVGGGALGSQHAVRICHIVMWPDPLYNIFPLYFINGTIFEIKNKVIEHKSFEFPYNVSLKHFSF